MKLLNVNVIFAVVFVISTLGTASSQPTGSSADHSRHTRNFWHWLSNAYHDTSRWVHDNVKKVVPFSHTIIKGVDKIADTVVDHVSDVFDGGMDQFSDVFDGGFDLFDMVGSFY